MALFVPFVFGPISKGVTHAEELWYVWGYPMLQFNEQIAQDYLLEPNVTYDADDVEQSLFMQKLWTNFAKFGWEFMMIIIESKTPQISIVLFLYLWQ